MSITHTPTQNVKIQLFEKTSKCDRFTEENSIQVREPINEGIYKWAGLISAQRLLENLNSIIETLVYCYGKFVVCLFMVMILW